MGYPAAKISRFLETSEPEVIIECPACQTKFRIEASKLEDSKLEGPNAYGNARAKARFHCSRCDYVFAAEVSTEQPATGQVQQEMEISAAMEASGSHSNSLDNNSLDNNQPAYQNTSGSLEDDIAIIPTEEEDLASRETEEFQNVYAGVQTAANFSEEANFSKELSPDETIHSDYLAPKSHEQQQLALNFTTAGTEAVPKTSESIPGLSQSASALTPSYNKPASSEIDLPAVDYSRYAQDFVQEDRDYPSEDTNSPKTASSSEPMDKFNSSKTILSAKSPISKALFSSSLSSGADLEAQRPQSSLNTILLLSLPLILILTLLGATTLYLRNNLGSGEKLLASLYPGLMREAPSGVFIQQPKLERLVLDSGDIVNVVSGTIVNQSKKVLTALTIEGLGFSDSGKIIATEKILAGNPVSSNNATLKGLSPSEIRDLQLKEPKNFLLRPENKTKFLLVFTNPLSANSRGSEDNDSLSSFAVRAYSARFRDQ